MERMTEFTISYTDRAASSGFEIEEDVDKFASFEIWEIFKGCLMVGVRYLRYRVVL